MYILFSAEWVLTILLSVAFPEIVLTLNTSSIQYETASLKIFYDAIPILSALIAMVVQVFYAWRMWLLSNRKLLILSGVVVILALGQFVCGCVATTTGSTDNPFLPYDSTGTLFELAPIMGWLAGGALVDIIIAVAMFILLRKSRRGERERDILLNRLIKHIVGSGIVTAGVALLALVLYVYSFYSDAALADCPILVLPKLYANTVFINLNNRDLVRRGNDEEEHRILYRDPSKKRHGLLSRLRKMLSRSTNNQGSLSVDPFVLDNLQGTAQDSVSCQESLLRTNP